MEQKTASHQLQANSLKEKKQELDGFTITALAPAMSVDTNFNYYRRIGMMVLILVFGIFGSWAAIAPLSSASVAVGEVVVESNNRVVEHLEGGIVSNILVEEGDRVEKGQLLLKLSSTQVEAELSIVQSQLNEMIGLESRLKAESLLADSITFPEELLNARDQKSVVELIDGQNSVFLARKDALEGELEIYRQRIEAQKQQISGLESLVESLDSRILSYQQEVADWEALFREQFADKIRLQEMKRELSRLRGEKSSSLAEIGRLKVAITENRAQLVLRRQQFKESVVSELRLTQSERFDLQAKRISLADRLERVSIIAPVSGQVNGLDVVTIGDVVSPGETLMEIVPDSKNYAVKAKVALTDIDKVYVGLLSDVRFSAFNTQMTHVIEGKVVHVSADKFMDEQTALEYFEAKVLLTEEGITQMEKDGIFLLPGMPAEVMIKTGERTLFGYFVKPFSNMFARSFNED